jgi:hypothetical protein
VQRATAQHDGGAAGAGDLGVGRPPATAALVGAARQGRGAGRVGHGAGQVDQATADADQVLDGRVGGRDRLRCGDAGLGVDQVGDGGPPGGQGGEAGHLVADAPGTGEGGVSVRPDLRGEVGVRGRGQHDDLRGVEQSELFGLLTQALRGDGVALAEAHLVAQDPVGRVEQPVPRGQVMRGVWGCPLSALSATVEQWS